jgi:hypothetical protein
MSDLERAKTLAGAAQTANHLRNGQNLYVSPFFFAISTSYLKELNYQLSYEYDQRYGWRPKPYRTGYEKWWQY